MGGAGHGLTETESPDSDGSMGWWAANRCQVLSAPFSIRAEESIYNTRERVPTYRIRHLQGVDMGWNSGGRKKHPRESPRRPYTAVWNVRNWLTVVDGTGRNRQTATCSRTTKCHPDGPVGKATERGSKPG